MSEESAFEDINSLPGYYIRHLHQISVAIFLQETEKFATTPVQFAVLRFVVANPDIDQRSVAKAAGLDASTTTGVIDRLEARGLLKRHAAPKDRRVKHVSATPEGCKLLKDMHAAVQRAQRLMLEPLPESERKEFVRMLNVLVVANNELSRAPKKNKE
ncbi:MAG TPA: MarR family winged helix-turn-helix transcriptional regulator [Eoetvoesiella sp.]|jgi:DNA-binding MarR family transcriptional regulator|uniref:MarR family winged helix-turn-helix transcriptional regulator n=1 Tax=Eoetvoesiella sp. TaxID=1966355 RepID=UPI002C3E1F5D|nr:MarR family winged helix-turn-helix transcriptional regulator [Eoetvoesiella sp.]HWK62788.1 MarR family winged helix-turn-helix transcriptional regulator [Eoetvoesiella sp.]